MGNKQTNDAVDVQANQHIDAKRTDHPAELIAANAVAVANLLNQTTAPPTNSLNLGNGLVISLTTETITNVRVDGIVNAANEMLEGGGGVDQAIHAAAGQQLHAACVQIPFVSVPRVGGAIHKGEQARCPVGEARVTPAFNIPHVKWVIHTVAPLLDESGLPRIELLKSCYEQSLHAANEKNCESLAFCALGTGFYGFPQVDACEIALNTTREWLLAQHANDASMKLKKITFCMFGTNALQLFPTVLGRIARSREGTTQTTDPPSWEELLAASSQWTTRTHRTQQSTVGLDSDSTDSQALRTTSNGDATDNGPRSAYIQRNLNTSFITDPKTSELMFHGRTYTGPLTPPTCTWKSEKPPRDDHNDCPEWLTASEFQDVPSVLDAKVDHLCELLRVSRNTVLYTGAGISASVIGQAARSNTNKQGWEKGNKKLVQPTPTHYALGVLGRAGLIHSWVQQNHDGLPQKAGFPQGRINEIHGSWFDPSNPVVTYSGNLHRASFPWMERDATDADLVIVIGTSLGGLNADQVATNCAQRSLQGTSLGAVCINLQQTPEDASMSLRLFGKSDAILAKVLARLAFLGEELPALKRLKWKRRRALVPYDKDGNLLPKDSKEPNMWWDLNKGATVKICSHNNIQGSHQARYGHIFAERPKYKYKGVMKLRGDGVGTIESRVEDVYYRVAVNGSIMSLGCWWMLAARRGEVKQLPIVNVTPLFEENENGDEEDLTI